MVAQTFLSVSLDAAWKTTRTGMSVLLFFLTTTLFAQQTPTLRIESTRGAVGTKINIPVRWVNAGDVQGNITLSGRIVLSNSSLFYPENWIAPQGSSFLASQLVSVNDSTYTFALSFSRTNTLAARDTLGYVRGEVLLGSDSVFALRFQEIRLTDARGSRMIAGTSGIIRVNFVDVDVPVVRFSQLQASAPNPVVRGTETRFAYTIDIQSDVTFIFYNLAGEEVDRVERKQQPRGAHVETWIPKPRFAAGAYFVRFATNSGDVLQRLLIE